MWKTFFQLSRSLRIKMGIMASKVNIEFLNSDESSYHTSNSFKQRRKTPQTPNVLQLTGPKPFKSLTNTYGSHTNPNKIPHDFEMDCADGNGTNLGGKATSSFSSSTLPSIGRRQLAG